MKILFIVNPISGSGAGKKLSKMITKMPEYKAVDYRIVFSERAGHAAVLAAEAATGGDYDHIVAVGGD
uniref:acylglycerol kinase family protein n=1 Tax=Candidatus Symbiothrix dinenymphae TaxID=467085 RepID=UPI000A4814C3